MAIEIIVPRLGWTMEEGVFGRWLKNDGDVVAEGDMIFELESDKATQEVESFDSGLLHIPADAPRPGDTVQVGDRLGFLLADGEDPPAASAASSPPVAAAPATPTRNVSTASTTAASSSNGRESRRRREGKTISPRALRVASELGVQWTELTGTGATGRIREADVRAAAANLQPLATATAGDQLPISTRRRIIAARMTASQQTTAHVTLNTRALANNLVSMREQFAANSQSEDQLVPSYHDFFCKLAGAALQKFPMLQAQWIGDHLVVPESVNMGMAVDTPSGLIVPVLHDVARLGIQEMAQETRALVQQARDGSLSGEQLKGATFTITNLGMYGIDGFTPIIDSPQCAILGVGRIVREAVVEDERVIAGWQVTLSLTFDHRIVDGAPAAQFLDLVRRYVEQPVPVLAN